MKTYQARKGEIERNWYLVDAAGIPLGRLASRCALLLRGKERPTFTPHVDTGGFVVIVNASRVKLTGRKLEEKLYYRHSGKPGGLKSISARLLLAKDPARLVSLAVKGMLPKNSLAAKQITKLKVYAEARHPHSAQEPRQIEIA